MFTGYWLPFDVAVSCGIDDFAYLSVLYGTGLNLEFLLMVQKSLKKIQKKCKFTKKKLLKKKKKS